MNDCYRTKAVISSCFGWFKGRYSILYIISGFKIGAGNVYKNIQLDEFELKVSYRYRNIRLIQRLKESLDLSHNRRCRFRWGVLAYLMTRATSCRYIRTVYICVYALVPLNRKLINPDYLSHYQQLDELILW